MGPTQPAEKDGGMHSRGQKCWPLYIPGKLMYRVGGCENHAASWCEGQSYQAVAGDFQAGSAFWRDLHDAALAGKRRRHIQISNRVKGQALRTSNRAEN